MELDIRRIMEHLPHRYPMLLVDRVLELVPGERIVAIKNVSINEPFFQGHFPHLPVMPGVLIIEALAQAAAIFSFAKPEGGTMLDSNTTAYYLVGIDDARFRKPVVPGDQLRLEVTALRISKVMCKYEAKAYVKDEVVAEAKIMCAIRDIGEA
ncbi:3-hydroxyacyl-ACP dehydratase FabZ [Pelistega sp. NLN82]|uniref:3-hydroxyacyl-[acyl-carrier-protein] dehydratase FabZ n=1 Tax=Pelistega ratti TaxID=2652177 RepID=A0A6L9Y444_9BURK|nr:3-hydroxyacyl-ACP dehydratase FabZ [Pelistega ratti]NEN75161.1 3-hydroxyacyl-ACP dehydratase FabZ [Pelistega ratti]